MSITIGAAAWPPAGLRLGRKLSGGQVAATAAAFRLDRAAGTAQLAGIGVRAHLRGRGLGRQLLTGALTWLRADGFEQVHARL